MIITKALQLNAVSLQSIIFGHAKTFLSKKKLFLNIFSILLLYNSTM